MENGAPLRVLIKIWSIRMSKESDFLLGIAFGLLTQVRAHLIRVEDLDGVAVIEDEYQTLKNGIEKQFYAKTTKERVDGN